MPLTNKQLEGLKTAVARYKSGEKYTCIAGYAGSGKAQPVDTLIPTPNGMKKLGELKIGDYVFDRLGNPSKILGIFPQGQKQCYKVGFSNNQFSLCAKDHLWPYYDNKGNLLSITTEEMLKFGLKTRNGYKYKIPQAQPVNYSHKKYEVDPYMIGVFLGDGCCKEKTLTLSSENEEIPKIIGQLIDATPEKNSEHNFNWTFRWNNYKKEVHWIAGNNSHRTTMRERPKVEDYFSKYANCLITESYNKDIPEEYKYGDINQRLSLIQGLLDTDGTISNKDNHRYNVRFTSTSFKLVNSLQEVLNSLGYLSTISVDKRSAKYNTNCCYTLSINIPNEEKHKLFRLTRKKSIALEAANYHKKKDYSKRAIVSIEPLEEWQEMVCIYVDNKEHLYLTNDYIVTHNTYLVNHIIAALTDNPAEDVAFIAPTGKAATILRQNGNPNPMTAHKLLYYAKQNKYGKYYFEPREALEGSYKIIVCDEVSMISAKMWDQLMKHNVYVLALGDPGQLDPPFGTAVQVLNHPHVFLDEIMRQALDSEIIRLSMHIRQGRPLATFPCQNQDVMIFNKWDLTPDMMLWADQCLCATNETRIRNNLFMRELKGYSGDPKIGEKIIGLTNHWNCLSDEKYNPIPLTNGAIGTITRIEKSSLWAPPQVGYSRIPIFNLDIETTDGHRFTNLNVDYNSLVKGEKLLTDLQEMKMKNSKKCKDPPYDFNYSDWISVHRFQGSQANKILVQEERFPFSHEEHTRWLYTACTRAASRLVIIKK